MGNIRVVGLGAGDLEQLPYGIYKMLTEAEFVYLRTAEHPVVEDLKAIGMKFESFDEVYETEAKFEDVYRNIANFLLKKAKEEDVIYAVPGHPLVAEDAVQHLLHNKEGVAGHDRRREKFHR